MSNLIENITFVDAQAMASKNPDTFEAPTQKELNNLCVGSFVKVCDELAGERYWTIIKEIKGKKIIAEVNNDLINAEYSCGDLVQFEVRNIYSIYED